ncbi:MAG: hypothetical protein AB7E72_08835 [Lysobacterales bacterium]
MRKPAEAIPCWASGRHRHRLVGACLFALVAAQASAQTTTTSGPIPYTSPASRPASFINTPVVIEDFEDSVIDPRINIFLGGTILGPLGQSDSVDGDDGFIDGSGNQGHCLLRNSAAIDVVFTTNPRVAGLVWTDGGQNSLVTVTAFAPDGTQLASTGPHVLGDGNSTGNTAEDRYFGFRNDGGIGRIRMQTDSASFEIDHIQFSNTVEPLIMGTMDDGNRAMFLAAPDAELPGTRQQVFTLPSNNRPHGVAFLGTRALYQDFITPRIFVVDPGFPTQVPLISLTGRSRGNGSLAVDPTQRYALSIGESADQNPVGEAVVVDFGQQPPQVSPIAGGLRVLSFVSEAIDFAPDGRAFVCHTDGVSVLSPPYQSIDFTMPFPSVVQTPSMCRLSRDGSRLFVTRVLSETTAMPNGVRTTSAPYSATSVFTLMPAPPDVQGLGPMAVSPDGQALIVGQQFLFPPDNGTRARAFLLRAPFDGQTSYQELTLPASSTGLQCTDDGVPIDCPGFEAIEVSRDGTLAVLSGNSGAAVSSRADRVPAVFIRHPFNDQARSSVAVPIGPAGFEGRGAGGIDFQPDRMYTSGFE